MDHHDHIELIRRGVNSPGGEWADLGAGTGAFTLALAELLGPFGVIHAVDKNMSALRINDREMRARFPDNEVRYQVEDFALPLEIPPLDGIVMANSLHFQRHQLEVVRLVQGYLRSGGKIVVVEYNLNRRNFAVPHPVPFSRWTELAETANFVHTKLLMTRPSRFWYEIYSAVSW
ncbi:MAG TPA: methyltransferase domain-containing protein [Dehalococcoidia bacterium]|nr:methyltransferase domain-containing protein [Dehalococcoidia bacterium]